MSVDVEFGRKETADSYRDDHEEYVCPADDDKRTRTVAFVDDAPEWLIEDATAEGLGGQAEREGGYGQADLDRDERDAIDWAQEGANVPKARAVKGILEHFSAGEPLERVFEPDLNVGEHEDKIEQLSRESSQRRDNQGTAARQANRDQRMSKAAGKRCEHAREHCTDGDHDACQFLQTACDYSESEIEEFLPDMGSETQGQQEITGEARGALNRSWQGYKGALQALREAPVQDLEENWHHAQAAAKAINGIRESHGQEPLHFRLLEDWQLTIKELADTMRDDCHECHHGTDPGRDYGSSDGAEMDNEGSLPEITTELETDAIDEDTLARYADKHTACNVFAFWYQENVNENAVVKDAIVGNVEHAFVYDPDLNATIDATLGQFDGDFGLDVADAGAWDGDQHPHINADDEVYEWTDRDAFNDHYDADRNSVSYVLP